LLAAYQLPTQPRCIEGECAVCGKTTQLRFDGRRYVQIANMDEGGDGGTASYESEHTRCAHTGGNKVYEARFPTDKDTPATKRATRQRTTAAQPNSIESRDDAILKALASVAKSATSEVVAKYAAEAWIGTPVVEDVAAAEAIEKGAEAAAPKV